MAPWEPKPTDSCHEEIPPPSLPPFPHQAVDESEWQHDAQAKRVLAIFNGENPWRDDFEMATERARSTDTESLFGCGSKRKRTWSR